MLRLPITCLAVAIFAATPVSAQDTNPAVVKARQQAEAKKREQAKPAPPAPAPKATPAPKSTPAPKPVATKPAVPAPAATPAPASKPQKPAPAAATPAPAPGQPGFFSRVFGRKKPRENQPSATGAPSATPAPTKAASTTPRPKRRPKPVANAVAPAGEEDSVDNTAVESKPPAGSTTSDVATTDTPNSEETKPAPATPRPRKGRKGKAAEAAVDPAKATEDMPPEGADPETLEKWKYDKAKTAAQAEPEIQSLKAKADSAATDDDARKALRAYNKALFGRMRRADSSIKERVDQMEEAVLKRLDEKPTE